MIVMSGAGGGAVQRGPHHGDGADARMGRSGDGRPGVHDLAGWLIEMPFALVVLSAELWLLSKLFVEVAPDGTMPADMIFRLATLGRSVHSNALRSVAKLLLGNSEKERMPSSDPQRDNTPAGGTPSGENWPVVPVPAGSAGAGMPAAVGGMPNAWSLLEVLRRRWLLAAVVSVLGRLPQRR